MYYCGVLGFCRIQFIVIKLSLSLDEHFLSMISEDLGAAMVFVRVCQSVVISFLTAFAAVSAAYVAKFFACVVRRVSMVCISVRTMAVHFATAYSIILFISFFPSVLQETFSIASTVFTKAVVTSLNSNRISSLFEGLDISSKLLG